jgi:hypothetical protein
MRSADELGMEFIRKTLVMAESSEMVRLAGARSPSNQVAWAGWPVVSRFR